MTPFTLQHRNIWLRANHELVGQVLAAKLKLRTDRNRLDSGFTVQRGENHRG